MVEASCCYAFFACSFSVEVIVCLFIRYPVHKERVLENPFLGQKHRDEFKSISM